MSVVICGYVSSLLPPVIPVLWMGNRDDSIRNDTKYANLHFVCSQKLEYIYIMILMPIILFQCCFFFYLLHSIFLKRLGWQIISIFTTYFTLLLIFTLKLSLIKIYSCFLWNWHFLQCTDQSMFIFMGSNFVLSTTATAQTGMTRIAGHTQTSIGRLLIKTNLSLLSLEDF